MVAEREGTGHFFSLPLPNDSLLYWGIGGQHSHFLLGKRAWGRGPSDRTKATFQSSWQWAPCGVRPSRGLAVGGSRNGGQEMTIRSIQTALMGQEMIIVGDGRPVSHPGATLWSGAGKDGVADDAFGLGTARTLGRHVATIALRLAGRK